MAKDNRRLENNILNMNDEIEMLERYIKGIALRDKESFKKLYEATKTAVYSFALSMLKNVEDAEDVLHDVYIKIFENATSYQEIGKPMAWVITITKNVVLNKIKKQKHNVDIDELRESLSSNEKINVEDKLMVELLFSHISDEERNIIILHIIAGYKYREIAHMLQLPLATVLAKYHRAIKKINKMYS